MAASQPTSGWRPSPRCPTGHALEAKTAAGTWSFFGVAAKACQRCGKDLVSGSMRHSCKRCSYHLCEACLSLRLSEMLGEEITISVYRSAQPGLLPGLGVEEDVLQVKLERGAKIRTLKAHLFELYGLPPPLQALRRDLEGEVLLDEDQVACDDDGDVLYLGAPLLPGMGTAGGSPLDGLLSGAMADLTQAVNGVLAQAEEHRKELEIMEWNLNVLMPAKAARPERRCRLTVVATARVNELLEMALLELDAEAEEGLVLEFAGQTLPAGAPLHALNLADGDTLLLVSLGAGRTAEERSSI